MYSVCKIINSDRQSPRFLSSYSVVLHSPSGRLAQISIVFHGLKVVDSDFRTSQERGYSFESVYEQMNDFSKHLPSDSVLTCRENVSLDAAIQFVVVELDAVTPKARKHVIRNAARNLRDKIVATIHSKT
jgi:hypothetical protein